MISRSPKKPRTIARTFNRAIRTSFLASALGTGFSIASGLVCDVVVTAQIPVATVPRNHLDGVKLRPAAKLGASRPVGTSVSTRQRDGWNLRWRRSDQVRPAATVPNHVDVFDDQAVASSGRLIPANNFQTEPRNAVRQVAHAAVMMPQDDDALPVPSDAEPNKDLDFFQDPFGLPAPPTASPTPREATSPPPNNLPAESPVPSLPSQSPSTNDLPNELRGNDAASSAADFFDASPSPMQPAPDATIPRSTPEPVPDRQPPMTMPGGADDGPSLPDLMRQNTPGEQPNPPRNSLELLPPPAEPSDPERLDPERLDPEASSSDREPFDNPFERDAARDADRRDRQRLRREAERGSGRSPLDDELERLSDDENGAPVTGISCEAFRKRIASQTIREVSLDISPPFRPDVIDEQEYQELKTQFDENQDARQWRSIDGRPLASGRLVDLAYEKVVIESADGREEELSINQLSEGDLAYISENWGLPSECLVEQVAYTPRSWTGSTITWKASNLCHNPLYFEEVNLERYGHTAGPVLQPIVSSAHFFANIAVLPYKKGIHPPSECQYALGYYRPGNCAPWIVPPVPLSVRGAARQAAEMTAAFWLIP